MKLYSESLYKGGVLVSLRALGNDAYSLEVAKREDNSYSALTYEPQRLVVSGATLTTIKKIIDNLDKAIEAEKATP